MAWAARENVFDPIAGGSVTSIVTPSVTTDELSVAELSTTGIVTFSRASKNSVTGVDDTDNVTLHVEGDVSLNGKLHLLQSQSE